MNTAEVIAKIASALSLLARAAVEPNDAAQHELRRDAAGALRQALRLLPT